MELVKNTPAPKPHEHVDGRCGDCYDEGKVDGFADGIIDGYQAAREETPDPDTVLAREAEELREAAKDAHRAARHGGRWEDCGDVVCAAIERFVYERTRPEAARLSEAAMGRMVAG